jgi:hypothetical protein
MARVAVSEPEQQRLVDEHARCRGAQHRAVLTVRDHADGQVAEHPWLQGRQGDDRCDARREDRPRHGAASADDDEPDGEDGAEDRSGERDTAERPAPAPSEQDACGGDRQDVEGDAHEGDEHLGTQRRVPEEQTRQVGQEQAGRDEQEHRQQHGEPEEQGDDPALLLVVPALARLRDEGDCHDAEPQGAEGADQRSHLVHLRQDPDPRGSGRHGDDLRTDEADDRGQQGGAAEQCPSAQQTVGTPVSHDRSRRRVVGALAQSRPVPPA